MKRITDRVSEMIERAIGETVPDNEEVSWDVIFMPQQGQLPMVMVYFAIKGAVLGSEVAMAAQGGASMMLQYEVTENMIRGLYEQAQLQRSQQLTEVNTASNGQGDTPLPPKSLFIPGN